MWSTSLHYHCSSSWPLTQSCHDLYHRACASCWKRRARMRKPFFGYMHIHLSLRTACWKEPSARRTRRSPSHTVGTRGNRCAPVHAASSPVCALPTGHAVHGDCLSNEGSICPESCPSLFVSVPARNGAVAFGPVIIPRFHAATSSDEAAVRLTMSDSYSPLNICGPCLQRNASMHRLLWCRSTARSRLPAAL